MMYFLMENLFLKYLSELINKYDNNRIKYIVRKQ